MSKHITLRLSDLNQVELESLYDAIPPKDKYELPKEILRKHYKAIYGVDLLDRDLRRNRVQTSKPKGESR
jgi:hypothetical protein